MYSPDNEAHDDDDEPHQSTDYDHVVSDEDDNSGVCPSTLGTTSSIKWCSQREPFNPNAIWKDQLDLGIGFSSPC